MLQLLLRNITNEVISSRYTNCQLLKRYYASGSAAKAATAASASKQAEDAVNAEDVVEAVAVPVRILPTIDATLRSTLESPSKPVTPSEIIENATKRKKIKVERLAWLPSPSMEEGQLWQQYKKLSKFRLTSLVVITAMGGYAIAPAPFDLAPFLLCSLGTGLLSAAANSINQYHEVPFDSQMSRTKSRVLVTGQLTPLHASAFAFVSATAGLSMLYFGVNGLTAALGAGNLLLYTSVYTPMKRMSILNTWVGSVVGSIPPLMGWAACTGSLDTGAWILAGVLYAWQFPHFNALSWNLRPDYSRAGYRMMAVTNPQLCRSTALRYTFVIGGLSLLAPVFDLTNVWFALETLPLNAYFCYLAYKFYKQSDSNTSRKLFRFSLLHLPALMLLFLFNKKRWFFRDSIEADATTTASIALNSSVNTSSESLEALSSSVKNIN